MLVRYPTFDLSTWSPQWGHNPEAVVIVNAGGIIPAAIERFLIRVMRQAKKLLDPVTDAELIADIEIFNKQEGQHLKLHAEYLLWLRDNGYPRILEFEAAFEAELQQFLASKPLDWNLAYSEGFESTGCAMAEAWINGAIAELCGDHGSAPMRLWMWHLAEEFEHRSVVHRVLEQLYGLERAFELRKAGAEFNRPHSRGHALAAGAYMHEVNRAGMTAGEVAVSVEREQAAWEGMAIAYGDTLNWVFQPGYDPAAVPAPRDYEAVLSMYAPAS